MIQGQFLNSRLTRWLLPVVLVLSLFSFSGSSSHSVAKQFDVRTEQIDPLRTSSKKTISFKVFNVEPYSSLNNSALHYQQITLSHTRDTKILADQCSERCLEFIVFNRTVLQCAPRSSDEDLFIS